MLCVASVDAVELIDAAPDEAVLNTSVPGTRNFIVRTTVHAHLLRAILRQAHHAIQLGPFICLSVPYTVSASDSRTESRSFNLVLHVQLALRLPKILLSYRTSGSRKPTTCVVRILIRSCTEAQFMSMHTEGPIMFAAGSLRTNDVNKTKFVRPRPLLTRPRPPELNKGTWRM